MKHIPSFLLWLATLLALAAPAATAQSREKLPDPVVTRATVEDEKGLQQWKDEEVTCPTCKKVKTVDCPYCSGDAPLPNCPLCEGTKKIPCYTCAGTGRLPDPLEKMPCIYCKGLAWYPCGLCGGRGVISAKDREDTKCGSCKGVGFFRCAICDGERLLPSVRVKRKDPGEAKLKDLKKVQEELQEGLEELEAWEPDDTISKNLKSLASVLKDPAKSLPPLKDMQKMLGEVLKGLTRAGSIYQGYEAGLKHQFYVFKDRSAYYMKYQIEVLKLCIARLEHNERISDGK